MRDGTAGTDLNRVHTDFTELFKIQAADPLTEDTSAKMMATVTNLEANAIMFKPPLDNEMTILHHVSMIGCNIIIKTVEQFGLCGSGKIATPAKFKPAGIIAANEVEVPCWDTLKKVKTVEEVESARDANTSQHYLPTPPLRPIPSPEPLCCQNFPCSGGSCKRI